MESAKAKQPWQLTATEVLPLLRSGDLRAVDYVGSLLHRIRVHPEVKAWVFLSAGQILQQAQKLDDIPVEKRGALHGLPVAVKDVILTKDMPTQYNSKLFESDQPINADANCILSLRAAGAIIFGKTTTTEFATSKQGNFHQNLTTNPHNPKRTPGGSSSGSGAAVGDFQVPIGLGTQTGGSIIRPASFNGCYGLKPTWGAISKDGISTWCPTLDTAGFFAQSVQDIDVLMDVFQIHDDEAVPAEPFSLRGSKFGFYKSTYWPNAGRGTQNAMEKAKAILEQHGAKVEDVDLPDDFSKVLDWHAAVLAREGQSSYMGQYLTERSKLHEDIIAHVENKKGISRKYQLEAYDNCARLRPIFDQIASKYDAIITPSVVDEAPIGPEHTGDMNFCSTWTIMHTPALNLIGFAGENGMPVGLTAVGPRFSDRHLLHVAKTLGPLFEAEGGWERKNAEDLPPPITRRRMSSGYRSH